MCCTLSFVSNVVFRIGVDGWPYPRERFSHLPSASGWLAYCFLCPSVVVSFTTRLFGCDGVMELPMPSRQRSLTPPCFTAMFVLPRVCTLVLSCFSAAVLSYPFRCVQAGAEADALDSTAHDFANPMLNEIIILLRRQVRSERHRIPFMTSL